MNKLFSLIIIASIIIGLIYILLNPYFFTPAETLYDIGIEKLDEGNDVIDIQEKKAAADYFKLAIDKGYKERIVYEKLHYAYVFTEDDETIENLLTEALKTHPNDIEFLFYRAKKRLEQQKYKSAIDDYNKVISSKTDFKYRYSAFFSRGAAKFMLGRKEEAEKDRTSAQVLAPYEMRTYEDYSNVLK